MDVESDPVYRATDPIIASTAASGVRAASMNASTSPVTRRTCPIAASFSSARSVGQW